MTWPRPPLAPFFILALPALGLAQDRGVDIQGGSPRLTQASPSVSMPEESVLLTLKPDRYLVHGVYRIYNSGETVTVPVGFPASGKQGRRQEFHSFDAWANDRKLATQSVPQETKEESKDWYRTLKMAQVLLPARSTTTVIMDFSAPYGRASGPTSWVSFDYGTGDSWKAPVGKVTFDVRFPEEPLGLNVAAGSALSLLHRATGQLVLEMSQADPQAYVEFVVDFTPAEACLSRPPGDKAFLDRYCPSVLAEDPARYPTLTVLRLQRNAFFARHGQTFKDPVLHGFFTHMDWYKPIGESLERTLTEAERLRVGQIEQQEKEIAETPPWPPPK